MNSEWWSEDCIKCGGIRNSCQCKECECRRQEINPTPEGQHWRNVQREVVATIVAYLNTTITPQISKRRPQGWYYKSTQLMEETFKEMESKYNWDKDYAWTMEMIVRCHRLILFELDFDGAKRKWFFEYLQLLQQKGINNITWETKSQ